MCHSCNGNLNPSISIDNPTTETDSPEFEEVRRRLDVIDRTVADVQCKVADILIAVKKGESILNRIVGTGSQNPLVSRTNPDGGLHLRPDNIPLSPKKSQELASLLSTIPARDIPDPYPEDSIQQSDSQTSKSLWEVAYE